MRKDDSFYTSHTLWKFQSVFLYTSGFSNPPRVNTPFKQSVEMSDKVISSVQFFHQKKKKISNEENK